MRILAIATSAACLYLASAPANASDVMVYGAFAGNIVQTGVGFNATFIYDATELNATLVHPSEVATAFADFNPTTPVELKYTIGGVSNSIASVSPIFLSLEQNFSFNSGEPEFTGFDLLAFKSPSDQNFLFTLDDFHTSSTTKIASNLNDSGTVAFDNINGPADIEGAFSTDGSIFGTFSGSLPGTTVSAGKSTNGIPIIITDMEVGPNPIAAFASPADVAGITLEPLPLPGALPMFASVMLGLGLLGRLQSLSSALPGYRRREISK